MNRNSNELPRNIKNAFGRICLVKKTFLVNFVDGLFLGSFTNDSKEDESAMFLRNAGTLI